MRFEPAGTLRRDDGDMTAQPFIENRLAKSASLEMAADEAVVSDTLRTAEQAKPFGVDVKRVVEGEVLHLLRQRLINARPALRALGV